MQVQIWEAVKKTHFLIHRSFIQFVFEELNTDEDNRTLFYRTIFESMHMDLSNIKAETFPKAEQNLEMLKTLLDQQGASEIFVNSSFFYSPTMNGMQIQKHSYLGRYLSFSSLM